jgi:hypothetical protein
MSNDNMGSPGTVLGPSAQRFLTLGNLKTPTTTPIVGLGFQSGSGKSTIARHLAMYPGCIRLSFAHRLKQISHKMFSMSGLQEASYYDEHYDKKSIPLPCGKTPVQIWIEVGTRLAREIDSQVWVNLLMQDIYRSQAAMVVIDDVRFENEFEAIQDAGGLLLHVSRPNSPKPIQGADNFLTEESGWHGKVINSGTVEELIKRSEDMVRNWFQMRDFRVK